MENNCDPIRHGVKRALSVYEKATIHSVVGKALVLPGNPPTGEGHRGEMEELAEIGFNVADIIGVESDESTAVALYQHYYDTHQIHLEEVGEFLGRSNSLFSYIHLDFCSQLNEDALCAMQRWSNRVAPIARVRVSTTLTRRKDEQLYYEGSLRRQVLLPLLAATRGRDMGALESRWDDIERVLENTTDSTQLICIIMLLNFFFGTQAWVYADASLSTPAWPEPLGRHFVCNIERFSYYEVGGKTTMFSVWADLFPMVRTTIPDEQWTVMYLKQFFSTISHPLPQFNPEMFHRD